jgi:hypothetical protein
MLGNLACGKLGDSAVKDGWRKIRLGCAKAKGFPVCNSTHKFHAGGDECLRIAKTNETARVNRLVLSGFDRSQLWGNTSC